METPKLFAVVLVDKDDSRGTTAHVFTDSRLWAWLHRPESFPADVEHVQLPIPGTDLLADVSVWDPVLDKAQNLVCLPGTGGQTHTALEPINLGASGTVKFDQELRLLRVDADVVEGQW